MKNFSFALTLLFSSFALHAQTPQQSLELWNRQGTAGYEDLPIVADLRLFEFEIGTGLNIGPKWEGVGAEPGANLIFELRLNRPEPWDIALQFKAAGFRHTVPEMNVRTTNFNPSIFVDYNIRPSRRTRFFAGVGFGGNFADDNAYIPVGSNTAFWLQDNANAFAVTPRAGVSLFNFLRITAEYTITSRDYSRFGLNIGLTLGGSYKSPYIDRRSGRQKFWDDVAPAIINSLVP
jgi:hypothetical protein